NITFDQLAGELAALKDPAEHGLAKDQFLAKIQRKRHRMNDTQQKDFEYVAGMSVKDFIEALRTLTQEQIANWFLQHPEVGKVLDRKDDASSAPVLISDHKDKLVGVGRGYG